MYDEKPDNGAVSDLNVVARNMEWRFWDAMEVHENAKQKLRYKLDLDQLYNTRCDLETTMNQAAGVEIFETFEQVFMNHVEDLLKSNRTLEDFERFHGLLTGKLLLYLH